MQIFKIWLYSLIYFLFFICSFRKHLISNFYILGAVLAAGYTLNKETQPSSQGAYSSVCGISMKRCSNRESWGRNGIEGRTHILLSWFQRQSFWRGDFQQTLEVGVSGERRRWEEVEDGRSWGFFRTGRNLEDPSGTQSLLNLKGRSKWPEGVMKGKCGERETKGKR